MNLKGFLVVSLMFLMVFGVIAPRIDILKADTSGVWQADFIWLVSADKDVYIDVQDILDAFRFTYFKFNLATREIDLSDFVSDGEKKYYGIIFQDGDDVGSYLGTSEIQAIRDAVTIYGLNLIVIRPEKASIKDLLGVKDHQPSAINPYQKNYRVNFTTSDLALSFRGSTAERDVTWNYLNNFTVTSATILATYNDTKSTYRPFFSVKQQSIGSLCFAVGIDIDSLDKRVGISTFMPAIVLGIALRDSVPTYRFIRPMFASIIVDDYILQGYNFQQSLINILKGKNARAAFGFIPKYYQQTYDNCRQHFKENMDYWELIMHGNDHTQTELNTNYATSVSALKQSVSRMDSLEQNFGVGYERVEVFPYEYYTIETFKALRDTYFLTSMSYYMHNGWDLESSCAVFDFSNYDYPSMGRGGFDAFDLGAKGALRAYHLFHAPIVFYFHPHELGSWLNNAIDFINSLGDVTWKKPSEIVSSAYDAKYDPSTGKMRIWVSKVRYPSLVINSTKYYYDLANSNSTHLYIISSSLNPVLESLTGVFQPAFNLTDWTYSNRLLKFKILSDLGAVAKASIYCGDQSRPQTVKINGLDTSFNYDEMMRLLVFNVNGPSTTNTVEINWGPPPPDTQPPTYSNIGHNNTVAGKPCLFYSQWQDNNGLSGYIFSTNNTGVWTNDTWTGLGGMQAWANVTKKLNNTGDLAIGYRWYSNDTSNNWGDTGIFTLTTIAGDTQSPSYSNIQTSTTVASNPVQFSCLWQDNGGLSGYIFSTNNTGAWVNDTFTGLSGLTSWANVTKTLYGTVGAVIGYRWYCVDSNDNWNDTEVQTLTTTYSAKPQYSSIGYNTTTQNQPCIFSSLWTDDQLLSGCIFGTNSTGSWVNDTWSSLYGSQSWVNKTKTLPGSVGVRVEFQWWCNDSQNQWTATGLQDLVTTPSPPPTYSNIGCNTTVAGKVALFSCYWKDDNGLSGFIFSWNGTGIWTNDTWTPLSGASAWANVTKTLSSAVGTVIGFKWYCNDIDGNWNGTITQTLTTTSPIQPEVFGKTSIGGTVETVPVGYVYACRFQAPQSGVATMISAYIHGKYQSGSVKAMIYSDVSGKADSLLFESSQITLSSSWAWHNFTFDFNLEAGKYYWFAVFASVESECRYDTGLVNQEAVAWDWTYPIVPAKFNGVYEPSYSAKVASMFVTYTPSGGQQAMAATAYVEISFTWEVLWPAGKTASLSSSQFVESAACKFVVRSQED